MLSYDPRRQLSEKAQSDTSKLEMNRAWNLQICKNSRSIFMLVYITPICWKFKISAFLSGAMSVILDTNSNRWKHFVGLGNSVSR